MSETIQDDRVKKYILCVQQGRDEEANTILEQLHAEAHAKLSVLAEKKEDISYNYGKTGFKTRIYRDLIILYRDCVALAKWSSNLKKVMREEKKRGGS